MKFLSTTLLYRFHSLVRKEVRNRAAGAAPIQDGDGDPVDALAMIAADVSGAVTKAVRRQRQEAVTQAIESLDPTEREIIILRGIEQNSVDLIAHALEVTPNAVYLRYHRALKRLRARLSDSVFDELE